MAPSEAPRQSPKQHGSVSKKKAGAGWPPMFPLMTSMVFCTLWLRATFLLGVDSDITSFLTEDAGPIHPQDKYIRTTSMTLERMEALRGPKGPKYKVLVTGAAGFIGMHTCLELERIGMTPIGLDNLNSYYSQDLKKRRVNELKNRNITFVEADVCDTEMLPKLFEEHNINRVIHLAAQAGVRYSLNHPLSYTRNNIDCMADLLEALRAMKLKEPFIYASSSSVYGNNKKIPFQESDRVEDPASLYAASKRAGELIANTYWNLHQIPSIGLRFFTVYGPWGRPDMAPWIFTDKITNNATIKVFNHGYSRRDFTYVDDIVQGVVNSLLIKPKQPELINLGNGRPVVLADFVRVVEDSVGKKAQKVEVGMQKGDVPVTYADISKAVRLLAYHPSTSIEVGITNFVQWFRDHDASQYRMK